MPNQEPVLTGVPAIAATPGHSSLWPISPKVTVTHRDERETEASQPNCDRPPHARRDTCDGHRCGEEPQQKVAVPQHDMAVLAPDSPSTAALAAAAATPAGGKATMSTADPPVPAADTTHPAEGPFPLDR